jgi:hemolysin type calcium-binding protein
MAKPIKGTKDADLTLTGTNGADRMLGGGGNDLITGGAGNDTINGGQGTDTAIFAGSYDDHAISWSSPQGRNGHGADDLRITVADTVGTNGTDQLSHVEWLRFDDALVDVANNVVYFADAFVDISAQDPPGFVINGSGIPADHYGIVQDADTGVELGLQIHYRQGPTVLHSDADGYGDGVLHFQVNDGTQSTANGSSVDNPGRAAWNFDYSIATGLDGHTTDVSDFTFRMLIDVDPSAATNYRVLTMQPGGLDSANVHWVDQDNNIVIADDEGNANVAQNSENYAFGFIHDYLGTYNYEAGAQFDIVLQAFDGPNLLAQNHIIVDVI